MNNLDPNALYILNQMVISLMLDETTRNQNDLRPKWLQFYIYNINQSLQKALIENKKSENSKKDFEETKKLVAEISENLRINKKEKQQEVLNKLENKKIQSEENLIVIDKISQNIKKQYPYFSFLILDMNEDDLIELYKHRKNLETYLKKRIPKRLKDELELIKKSSEENFDELLKTTMDSINEISFKTGYNIETIIKLLKIGEEESEIKENAGILLEYSERYQNIINAKKSKEEHEDENKNKNSSFLNRGKNSDELKQRKNEKNSNKSKEIQKEETVKQNIENNIKEKQETVSKTKKIIKSDQSSSAEFAEYLENISKTYLAKENAFPIFLHIYSKENGGFFDFFSKEKMKKFYELFNLYEKQNNRRGKIFIFTNKNQKELNKMIKEFQKFEQENGQKMLEGGISKYGTYFCDMEGKQIPLVKINNENYEIGKKEIDSVMYEGFSNEYLDKNEKDFWSFKFPKNFGKGTTLRMYDLIKRKLFQQKNEVEVLGYTNKNFGVDVILNSQAKAKDRINTYCKTKFHIEPNLGISISPNKFDKMLQKIENKLEERDR